LPTTSANMVQKTTIQTFQASFATQTLSESRRLKEYGIISQERRPMT
jgi:phage gp45-like